jgi:hypothetical protein
MVKLNERMEAGTDAATVTDVQVNHVSQTIAKPHVSGWVSVYDDLPNKNLTVDVVIKNEYGQYRIPNAEYRLKDVWHKSERFESYQHTDDGMQWIDITKEVTHWMLPPVLPH